MKTLYWSKVPGRIANKETGAFVDIPFPGNRNEWYQTLIEIIRDAAGKQPVKLVTSPDVVTILEHLVFFRPTVTESYNAGDGTIDNITTSCDYSAPPNLIKFYNSDDEEFANIVVLV